MEYDLTSVSLAAPLSTGDSVRAFFDLEDEASSEAFRLVIAAVESVAAEGR